MKIKVFYSNGRIKTYDTDTFCDSTPFLHDNLDLNNCNDNNTNNISIMTSFDLRLDFLLDNDKRNEKGIFLFVDYYDIICDENLYATKKMQLKNLGENRQYYVTHNSPGRCIPIVNPDELSLISHIDVDGEMCIKNLKGHIINVQKQKELYSMRISDNNNVGFLEQVYKLYENMNKEEGFKKLEISEKAKELGLDKDLLEEILKNETIKNRVEKEDGEIIEISQIENDDKDDMHDVKNKEIEGGKIEDEAVIEVEEDDLAIVDDVENAVVEEDVNTGVDTPAPEDEKEEKFGADAYSIESENKYENEIVESEEKFGADAYKIEDNKNGQNNEIENDEDIEQKKENLVNYSNNEEITENSMEKYYKKSAEFDNELFSDEID